MYAWPSSTPTKTAFVQTPIAAVAINALIFCQAVTTDSTGLVYNIQIPILTATLDSQLAALITSMAASF